MITDNFKEVLEATGYLERGEPASGVQLYEAARLSRRGRNFEPDALWRGPSQLTVYFKFQSEIPNPAEIATWRREIWNEGFAPLLWIISPKRIDVYNGFGRPLHEGDAEANRLRTFRAISDELQELDTFAGRLAMETGQFWSQVSDVDRSTGVDRQLLRDLAALEADLVREDLNRDLAQALIGRIIFTQYLVDRGILDTQRLKASCGAASLSQALRNADAASALFSWLSTTFNGDMFPAEAAPDRIRPRHLLRAADFLEAVDPQTLQGSLFPYQFDIIPVELISSIYEQFAHAVDQSEPSDARAMGVHYTRLSVVSLILDEVLSGLDGNETVLDLTCGSGVFLVEAFRRLVALRSNSIVTRDLVRKVLHEQICGVDISEEAVRVAAFSLYLAALELDPDPQPPEALRFKPLINHNLFVADARSLDLRAAAPKLVRRGFDVIVGNPPWTFRGKRGTAARRSGSAHNQQLQPRGEGLDFLARAAEFSHDQSRFGVVLDAMPFFAASGTGAGAAVDAISALAPVTLVNLAAHTGWLFGTASKPAIVLLARHRGASDRITVVDVPWSPAAERSHTFSISPNDIRVLGLREFQEHPEALKAWAVGRSTDISLLSRLGGEFSSLDDWLASIGTSWRDGLIFGDRSKSAAHLDGLELVGRDGLQPFAVQLQLPRMQGARAERPRTRDAYSAPILLLKEFIPAGARAWSAVAVRDLAYTEAYFGAALGKGRDDVGRFISGVLSSSLASWFFVMTAAEFGLWKRRLFRRDVGLLPIPDPTEAIASEAGQRVVALVKRGEAGDDPATLWPALDRAVGDAYCLDEHARLIVADGLTKAGWQWDEGKRRSAAPVSTGDLAKYASVFGGSLQSWLDTTGQRHVSAEIYDLPVQTPVRICRFVLEEGGGKLVVSRVAVADDLQATVQDIGQRTGVRLGTSLFGTRELRVHGENEVIVIKPAAARYWMASRALEDANAVVVESFSGAQR